MSIIERQKISEFQSIIEGKQNVAIFTHTNPDGDAIGSALAMQIFLRRRNIASKIIIGSELPDSLRWMPGSEDIVAFPKIKAVQAFLASADLVVCLDFNEPSRTDYLAKVLEETTLPVLVVDHHPQVHNYNGLLIGDIRMSSTAELLFWLLKLSDNLPRTAVFATCIYTGIVTDTGSFSYNSSNPSTYRAMAELLEMGFDKDLVTGHIFQQFSLSRMQLLGHMLAHQMVLMPKQGASYTYLSRSDLEKYNHKPGDNEGFVNYPLSIIGVNFTAFFVEQEKYVKISFRSKGSFAANEFSKRFFNGGGHRNAAGGRSYDSLDDTLKRFEKLVKEHYHEF
ncbi:MAG: bifunctional oligoribonuclease/PAP phosphatase NrnA [Salinivirgaceae bacterium]